MRPRIHCPSLNMSVFRFHKTVQTDLDGPRRMTRPTFTSLASSTCKRAGNFPRLEGGGMRRALSMVIWPNHLKACTSGGGCLVFVVGHQPRHTEFFHRRQMQPIQSAAMNLAGMAML